MPLPDEKWKEFGEVKKEIKDKTQNGAGRDGPTLSSLKGSHQMST